MYELVPFHMLYVFYFSSEIFLARYFEDLGSLSPLKPDRALEAFRADLDMGAFELLTCSPIKVLIIFYPQIFIYH